MNALQLFVSKTSIKPAFSYSQVHRCLKCCDTNQTVLSKLNQTAKNDFSHQEYSYSGAQCQRESWCSLGWMDCSHPTGETPRGYLYGAAPEQEVKLERHTDTFIKYKFSSVYTVANALS